MPGILQSVLAQAFDGLSAPADAASTADPSGESERVATISNMMDILHGYLPVFVVAFLIALLTTPICRRLAVGNGVVDHPREAHKAHARPIAYLGGVAIFLGLLAGIMYAYMGPALSNAGGTLEDVFYATHESRYTQYPLPVSILLGMTLIMLTGLVDDVVGLSPRLKIAGQLLAAAALAMQEVGTKVAAGILRPFGALIGNSDLVYRIPLPLDVPILAPDGTLQLDLIYWTGTAIIALFVLGACNASNLVDGLDGLLSGITAIAAFGFLFISLMLASADDGSLDESRIILSLSLMGACLGFLPHNFNPATIFLGDAGSLLLGYTSIVIILTLGNTGQTHLVVAGLIIYSIPIIDTVLAIVRRKMAGRSMSEADDQHLHHMLKRALGVKGAVLALYACGIMFAALGVWLSYGRVRVVFTIAMIIWAFIGVTAVKAARRAIAEMTPAAGP